jgi:hypothetical protein
VDNSKIQDSCSGLRLLALLPLAGFRERLMADPSFLTKLAIEVGIGVCTKCTAEYTKRGPSFNKVRPLQQGCAGRHAQAWISSEHAGISVNPFFCEHYSSYKGSLCLSLLDASRSG